MSFQGLAKRSIGDLAAQQGCAADSAGIDESIKTAELKAAVLAGLDDLEHGRFKTINDAAQLTDHIHSLPRRVTVRPK